jgi:hypothetical protein
VKNKGCHYLLERTTSGNPIMVVMESTLVAKQLPVKELLLWILVVKEQLLSEVSADEWTPNSKDSFLGLPVVSKVIFVVMKWLLGCC